MTRRRGGGWGRGEGGGNEGECGNAPKLSSPSVLSSEFAVRSPFLFFLCRLLAHLIVACLITSKFKEAKMTSSLSRFALFLTQKRKFMEIMLPGGVPCLPFGL